MYKALVHPHLDYFDVIYHISPKEDQLCVVLNSLMEMAEKVPKIPNHSKLYEELGWESLSDHHYTG